MWEKEKMLVTSIFSFFHHVFTIPYTNFNFWATFILSLQNAFDLNNYKIFSLGKEFTLYHTIQTFNDLKKEAFWKQAICL